MTGTRNGTGFRNVGLLDPPFQRRIVLVLVVVVGVLLSGGVRRVAHDHGDRRLLLPQHAVGVLDEHPQVQLVPVLVHLEGVGQHRPLEGHVLAAHAGVVGVLDVHDHDVVGKQQQLV